MKLILTGRSRRAVPSSFPSSGMLVRAARCPNSTIRRDVPLYEWFTSLTPSARPSFAICGPPLIHTGTHIPEALFREDEKKKQ
eukprot:15357098-Heterocapsa_arctica.AAC.1